MIARRVLARALTGTLPVAAALALQPSCASDPPPICPDGDCNLPGSTIVKWRFNHYPEWAFDSDTCLDVGAARVQVQVTHVDDPTITDVLEKTCGEGQVTFIDLPVGTYTVAVTPLDSDGTALVTGPVTSQMLAGSVNARNEIVVDVPYTAWARAFTGQFLFRLSWGGASCELATPAVAEQVLTLTVRGQVVTATTDSDQRLDGSEPAPCRPSTEQVAQFVKMLPFGPATLRVAGTGPSATDPSVSEVLYEHEFETFVGAGMFNPTMTFDVPAAVPPSAGVGAPPDAL